MIQYLCETPNDVYSIRPSNGFVEFLACLVLAMVSHLHYIPILVLFVGIYCMNGCLWLLVGVMLPHSVSVCRHQHMCALHACRLLWSIRVIKQTGPLIIAVWGALGKYWFTQTHGVVSVTALTQGSLIDWIPNGDIKPCKYLMTYTSLCCPCMYQLKQNNFCSDIKISLLYCAWENASNSQQPPAHGFRYIKPISLDSIPLSLSL